MIDWKIESSIVEEIGEDPLEELNRRAQLTGSFDRDLAADKSLPKEEAVEDSTENDTGMRKVPMVLVAEDEPDVRKLIVSQLRDYKVIVASDGEEAYQMAKKHLPDLLLLDWMMPQRDGLEVCKLIRAIPVLARVPILILTARFDERSKIDALQAGASDFLNKPFLPIELKLRIQSMLETRGYETEVLRKSEELGEAIKDLQESESMLVQAEKLTSLGEMSAGIIHEINNPLNYAKTNLYSLRTFVKALPEG